MSQPRNDGPPNDGPPNDGPPNDETINLCMCKMYCSSMKFSLIVLVFSLLSLVGSLLTFLKFKLISFGILFAILSTVQLLTGFGLIIIDLSERHAMISAAESHIDNNDNLV